MAHQSKPVVIEDTSDDDAARIMDPERQEAFLDALTGLCRQWGIRIKDMQTCAEVKLAPLANSYDPEGRYRLSDRGRITWYADD